MNTNSRFSRALCGIASIVLILSGCTKLEGACEYAYVYSNDINYYCEAGSAEGDLPFSKPKVSDVCIFGDYQHLHEGRQCSDIGYNQPDGSGGYKYNANADKSPSGYYASNPIRTGGSSSTGGGTSGGDLNCNSVWTGSSSDVQVSSVCATACVYYNAGGANSTAAISTCAIINQYGTSAKSSCQVPVTGC